MAMAGYAARRALFYLLILLAISALVFFPVNITARNDIWTEFRRTDMPAPEVIEAVKLREPLFSLYLQWLGGLFTGDWGESLLK